MHVCTIRDRFTGRAWDDYTHLDVCVCTGRAHFAVRTSEVGVAQMESELADKRAVALEQGKRVEQHMQQVSAARLRVLKRERY